MKLTIYQVDAFTKKVFGGNPAAVCILDQWLDEDLMQRIANENNLSETAFVVPLEDRYAIRWFTPAVEVDLCGHATLAPYWAGVLGKTKMTAKQLSARGGDLECEYLGERVKISGQAVTYFVGEIQIA